MVERRVDSFREGGDEEALRIALDQDHAAREEHLSTGDVEIARKVIDFRLCQVDGGGRAADGPVVLRVLEQQD